MNRIVYLTAAGALTLAACDRADKGFCIIEKNTSFPVHEQLTSSVIENDSVFTAEEWIVADTTLVCMSTSSAKIFNVLSLPSLDFVSSYGVKGGGPDEFISPHLVGWSGTSVVIIDNGGQKEVQIADDSIVAYSDIPAGVLVNRPCLSPDGAIVYLSMGADGPYVGILDSLRTDERVLVNLFEVDTDISNLSFDFSGDYVVAASSGADKVLIYNLNTHESTLMRGIDNVSFYYSDVICGEDSFLLLSQRTVNGETYDGASVMERYAYDGSPISEYPLDFIAFSAVYAPDNKMLVMTSPMDDDFHIVDFSF